MKESVMKAVSWVAGILGLLFAVIGVVAGLLGTSLTVGRPHNPVTFLILGILFLVIGIWAAVQGVPEKK